MSRWPVATPPPERHHGINLRGTPPDPAVFDGPLNVFIELHGTAVANNTATQTKKDYDTLHPPAVARRQVVPPQPPPSTLPPQPISIGEAVSYDNGIVDPGIAGRVLRRRRGDQP